MAFDPITAVLDIGGKLIDKLIPDPGAKAAAQLKLLELQQTGALAQLASDTDIAKGQLAIAAAEAGSKSVFVAGARPFILWVCGSALAYATMFEPLITWTATLLGYHGPVLPHVDTSLLYPTMGTILGVGTMRSYDKKQALFQDRRASPFWSRPRRGLLFRRFRPLKFSRKR